MIACASQVLGPLEEERQDVRAVVLAFSSRPPTRASAASSLPPTQVADPLEEERQDVYCKENPGADECKVYDD